MQRVTLTNDLTLSRIIYGMWRLGDDSDTSTGHVQAKIEACLAQGITSFDQADIYGDYSAEAILGECLKAAPNLRDQMQIITKCDIIAPCGKYADKRVKYYDTSAAHIKASVDASLTNMAIDTIDCLLIHRPDPFMDHRETGAALDALVTSGKVRSVGVSNFKLHDWTLLQSAMKSPLVTNQIEVSVTEHTPFSNGDIAYLQERGIAPMAWSPLGGGSLFASETTPLNLKLAEVAARNSVDTAAVAVAWLLAHPSTIMPVMGTNTLTRIAALSDAFDVEMDRETWFDIYTMSMGREVA